MRNVDSLNNIVTEYDDIDISTYFKAMDITKEQQEEREEAAEDIWWLLLLLFALIQTSIEDGNLDYNFIRDSFYDSYGELVRKYVVPDEYIEDYILRFTQNVVDTTWENMNFSNSDDDYWTSEKRALEIGLNESNSINNYKDFKKAVEEGYTHKTWKAELDNKTRKDHSGMNQKSVPIMDMFKFPDCEMLFPHDEINGTARQTVNCRCALKYTKE